MFNIEKKAKKIELKVEYQGNHASFLDLDIKIENSFFVHKEVNFHFL